jgi:hypothetical protein
MFLLGGTNWVVISQKKAFFIVTAVKISNVAFVFIGCIVNWKIMAVTEKPVALIPSSFLTVP